MTRTRLASLLPMVILAALYSGCSSPAEEGPPPALLTGKALGKVTQLQLREELKDFADRFAFTVGAAANEIRAQSPDRKTCVSTIYWQLFTIPSCRRSAVEQNPVAGLVDVWTFCKQLVRYFEDHGEEAFGEWTRVAVGVSRQLEGDISGVAAEVIPEQYLNPMETAINEFVKENPISGTFARRSLRPAMVKASEARSLMWVADLPLVPFRAFMDEHAAAIREFTMVADSMLIYAQSIPNVLRWQLQLLLYDIEERESTTGFLSSFEKTSDAMESVASAAHELPDRLSREVTAALDATEAKQAGIRETLEEVRATLSAADKALANAETVAATLETTTKNWNEAAGAWEKAVGAADVLVARFTGDDAQDPTSETVGTAEEDGFDIRDYTETAVRAEAAAARLQELTQEARGLLESDSASALVDRVVWSTALLIVVFFGSLLAYRVVAVRFARTRPETQDRTPSTPSARSGHGRLDRSM